MPDWVKVGLEAGDAAGHRFNSIVYQGPDGPEAAAAYVACATIRDGGTLSKMFTDARPYKVAIPVPN